MEHQLQLAHLFFILLIVLVIFVPGKLPDLGKGLGRALLDLRGQHGWFRGALFMAKGVDPAIGRDVGDMLPDEEARRSRPWFLFLLALLVGNTLYFLFSPFLPPAARMEQTLSSPLPALVDLWFCLFAFGALSLLVLVRGHNKAKK